MTRRACLAVLGATLGWLPLRLVGAPEDPGKSVVGEVTVTVYYATDGDPAAAGPKATVLGKALENACATRKNCASNSTACWGMTPNRYSAAMRIGRNRSSHRRRCW